MTYVTTPLAGLSPGNTVRVELTPAGAEAVGGSIGSRARYLVGRSTAATSGKSLVIETITLTRDGGSEETLNGSVVEIPGEAIARLELYSHDGKRTVVAVTGTIVAAILAGRMVGGGGGGTGGGPGRAGQ